MDWITVSTFITAIATSFIAYYSYVSNKLSNEIRHQEKNYRETLEKMTEQHHKDLGDLYQAIVIATLIGGKENSNAVKGSITVFKEHYHGGIEIFKKEDKT